MTRPVVGHVLLALCVMVTVLAGIAQTGRTEPRTIDLAVRNGQLAKAVQVVRIRQGDDTTLLWTTDMPFTIHLHGYDLETRIVPGTPVAMRFTARAAGRFAIEIHGHGSGGGQTLGYLEVHPR